MKNYFYKGQDAEWVREAVDPCSLHKNMMFMTHCQETMFLNFNNGDEFVLSHSCSYPDVSVTKSFIFNKCIPENKHRANDSYINL